MWLTPCIVVWLLAAADACKPSVTSVSGTHAPDKVCSGDLIFSDEFDKFDLKKWQHEITLSGSGNWEFQYYNNNRTNSYTKDGVLFIRPSLMADQYGEAFLTSGRLNIDGGAPADRCTNPQDWGCDRTGTTVDILNPIKSARIRTVDTFNFCYGRIEVRAKMPAGDWLWPAIWLMPVYNMYGLWPASGEIDLVESRGNRDLYFDKVNIGTQQVTSTLHFGPYSTLRTSAHWSVNDVKGYDAAFHRYGLEWTPDYMRFTIDDVEIGKLMPDDGGLWEYGKFNNTKALNPWESATKMAPFDQNFYIIVNLAVGGVNGFFPENATNPYPKPWTPSSVAAATDFWKAKEEWLPTWHLDRNDGEDAALQVDYFRVWAL